MNASGGGQADDDWFLTRQERGNEATAVANLSHGNLAVPRIHGAEYFDRLVDEVEALEPGDYLLFTDWRGDPDERMRPDGPSVAELLGAAASRGVIVKGLLWRSHLDRFRFSEEDNRHLGEHVEAAGGEVLLDQRVRRGGSHHQKFVVLRHYRRPELDVAFAGGIDLCHSRRDDAEHHGDPQTVPMSDVYGPRPPWHDVQLEVRGPVVGVLDRTFRERWMDPRHPDVHNPGSHLIDKLRHADLSAGDLPPLPADPAPVGPHTVQVLRTYPAMRPPSPYAPRGERSVARGYTKAVQRARRLIYLEDQYMWSTAVARLFAEALRDHPQLQLVVVVPRVPDQDGGLALPPNHVGREQALDACRAAGPDRVHVFDLENHEGTPVYVHAKVCVVDDAWASVGSDNFNRRSWTHDSELSLAVLDQTADDRAPVHPDGQLSGTRRYARDLRLRLWREHLDRATDGSEDSDLLDPDEAVAAFVATAEALQAWYDGGRQGPRPPGRVRPHQAERLPRRTKLWAEPVYRLFYDPDGRPLRMRGRQDW